MIRAMRPALVLLALMTVLLGGLYPLAVWGVGRLALGRDASGALLMKDGEPVGLALLGQTFEGPRYFWSRPCASPGASYNPMASGGSQMNPAHPALIENVTRRAKALRAVLPPGEAIPADLVTASASGLDPHISPQAALAQIPRVAKARGIEVARVREIVLRAVEPRAFLVLGQPRVNVLRLNLALDSQAGAKEAKPHKKDPPKKRGKP